MQQNNLMMLLLLALLFCDMMTYLEATKCFVCGPSPHDLLENANFTVSSNNCSDFDSLWKQKKIELARETFGRDCPEDHMSCLLQRDANRKITVRSCEKLNLSDCKKANNVSYCYCAGDYCNFENVPDQPHILTSKDRRQQQLHSMSDEINDDEDLNDDEDGSGSREHSNRKGDTGRNARPTDKAKSKTSAADRPLLPKFAYNGIIFGIWHYSLAFFIYNQGTRIS